MAVAEQVSDAEKYKALWLEAKALNAEAKAAALQASKAVKSAQDAQAAAEAKAAEADALSEELAFVKGALGVCEAEYKSLAAKLGKAESKIEAAQKIAEGLAELS